MAKVVGHIYSAKKHEDWQGDESSVWSRTPTGFWTAPVATRPTYQHILLFSEHEDFGPNGEPGLVPTETYFPSLSKRERPSWSSVMFFDVEDDLAGLFSSLYTALDHDLTVLAASGIRTVFDLATTKLGIDAALTFEQKIEELKTQGRIGAYEQEDLAAMVDAASAAMHRGWKPSSEELDTMMTTLERFIHHSFMLKGKAGKLKEKVPPKPARKKD